VGRLRAGAAVIPALARGDRRIYTARANGSVKIDGAVSYSIPGEPAPLRHQLRRRLVGIGLRAVSAASGSAPVSRAEVEEILADLNVALRHLFG
jgi:hypothetical protein